MVEARCPYCGRWFKAVFGKGRRQKTCGSEECKRAHKRELDRRWREENPGWVKDRQVKVRAWAQGRGYWNEYRAKHGEYAEQNRVQTRERVQRRRQEERRGRLMRADPVRYLEELKARCVADVCKTGTGERPRSTGDMGTAEDVCKTGTGQGVLSTAGMGTAEGDRAVIIDMVDYLIAREVCKTGVG